MASCDSIAPVAATALGPGLGVRASTCGPTTRPQRRLKLRRARKPMHILLVEDNPGDVRLVREALSERRLRCRLNVAENGVEALAFLRRQGKHADAPRPHLIFLDLSLPLKDGREVLEEIKNDQDLRRIPVVILTSSRAEQDICKSYDLHVNCYISKRLDLRRFITVVQVVQGFWFNIAILPPR
jgi:two-component system, chemotaxis family, response regulator Rcp1